MEGLGNKRRKLFKGFSRVNIRKFGIKMKKIVHPFIFIVVFSVNFNSNAPQHIPRKLE